MVLGQSYLGSVPKCKHIFIYQRRARGQFPWSKIGAFNVSTQLISRLKSGLAGVRVLISQGYLHSNKRKYLQSLKFINNRGRMAMFHCQLSRISKISIFKNIYLENRFIQCQWAFKQFCFEEIRRINDLPWEIVKYKANLFSMFNIHEFVALFFCAKQCTVSSSTILISCNFPKLPCLV